MPVSCGGGHKEATSSIVPSPRLPQGSCYNMAMLALLAIPALVLYLARCFRVYLRNSEQYVRPQCFWTHDMNAFWQRRIPAVGSDNLLYSFWTAVRCIYESPVVFEEGYRRVCSES